MDNARYNVAVSAYQGRNSQNILGDPQDNYALISQKQKVDAYEKGGIPSDHIVGLNFAHYSFRQLISFLQGPPETPAPLSPQLTDQEVDQIHKKYLETKKQRK